MIYKDYCNDKLSTLGFGLLRLPVIDGDKTRMDIEAVGELVDYAIKGGINYFDTAFLYQGGNAEKSLSEIFRKYPRDSYYFATKYPGYHLKYMKDPEKIFEEELRNTGLEYFDYYLLHNVCELSCDAYLDDSNNVVEYLIAQKKAGRIRHLGFSSHSEYENLKYFLERRGKDMDFCQIQLNWLDWEFQRGREKVELLKEYGIPVWVMEPLRGGKLIKALESYDLSGFSTQDPVELSFRFLQSIPEVKVVLSGMSTISMLEKNISVFDRPEPLSEKEMDMLQKIAETELKKTSYPCTGCRYCTDNCPAGIDIPRVMEFCNEIKFSGDDTHVRHSISAMEDNEKPSACVGCRSCERSCPQNLKITEAMEMLASYK